MPSFFKKLFHSPYPGGKKNPYQNPHHPNHNPSPSPGTSTFQPQAPAQPASPRGSIDYLAEARQAVGRDPVTGKRVVVPPASAERGGNPNEERDRDRTAFQDRNHGVRQTSGTRYDLFVQEMKERKEGGMREPHGGYYAPERRLGEFYAPERRLGEFYAPGGR